MRMLAAFVLTLAATAGAASAQEVPGRVGRVAYIEGTASVYQDPETGWEKAYVNSPVTSENSVWTDANAHAEVRVSGVALRLDQLTQLDVARLDDQELDAFVARGSLAVRVRHHEPDERLTFNTPNSTMTLRGDGRYRIDVDPDRNESRITVLQGEAWMGPEGRQRVAAGRSVLVTGLDPPQFVEENAVLDGFDRWVAARDQHWTEGRSTSYVSAYMTGYEDLDANGQWSQEPDYGAVWYPSRVAADWAPYRYGHWDNVGPWGWTWIDDASWGYAPFHYGRWAYVRDRWGWVPGERIARPVWAPALVAWVGGSGLAVGVSSGPAVGWYPLSPWDRYQPWFHASPAYVSHVNVIVREPRREEQRQWHEWTRERGTTVVDRRALIERQPIARAALRVNPETMRRAQPATQPSAVLPSRQDFVAHHREQPRAAVPAPAAAPQAIARPGAPNAQPRQEHNTFARPDFSRRPAQAVPQPAAAPAGPTPPASREAQRAQERGQREAQQQQERAQREAQQQQQQQRQSQERAQREAQQQQERTQREAQQQQQQQQHQSQERAQHEAQQQQERAQREAQQQQQRQAQERAQHEAQQQQERAQREAQQQQQRQAQERAQREAQQQQERAQREAQQQQQRQAQERAQREAQQQQERAQREAQQQQQRQAQERAQHEAQQQQERAQREAQQQQQRQAQERAQQERASREAQQHQQRENEKEKEKERKDSAKGDKP